MSDLNQRAADIARAESRHPDNLENKINNRGPRVDEYLRVVGKLPDNVSQSGPAYCGMFVYYCYEMARKNGEENPLPRKVFSASKFSTWANAHPDKIVYRAGGEDPILKPGDVFVANHSHVGMVVEPLPNSDSGKSPLGFISVEGNQASPVLHPKWGDKGVREKRVLLTTVSLIYRP